MAQDASIETAITQISSAIKSLDTQLKMIAQEIKTIKSNERIMGQTIVALNNKTKDLERKIGELQLSTPTITAEGGEAKPQINMAPLEDIKNEIELLKKNIVNRSEVDQIKYTLDLINPLQYVTASDVEDIIKKVMKKTK